MSPPIEPKRLADPGRVVSLTLSRDGEMLSLAIRVREERTRCEVGYEFLGVSDLQFRGERTELKELVLMVSEDISGSGWEGANFRVTDHEEEFLSFLCGSIRRVT